MVFLNDTLTHWAWVIPIIALILVEFYYLPNNYFTMYAIIFMIISIIMFLILGKGANLFGPKVYKPSPNDPTGVIRREYTDSHQNAYIIFIVFIIISVILSGLSIKKGNTSGS